MPPPPFPSRDEGRRAALIRAAGPLFVIGLVLALSALIQLIHLLITLSLPAGGGGGQQVPTFEGMLPLIGQGVLGVLILFSRFYCSSVWRRGGGWAAGVSAVATLLGLLGAGGLFWLALEMGRSRDGAALMAVSGCCSGLMLVTAEVAFWVFLGYYGAASRSSAVPVLIGCLATFAAVLVLAAALILVAIAERGANAGLQGVLMLVVAVGQLLFAVFYAIVVLATRQAGLAEARRIRTAAAADAAEVTDPWDDLPEVQAVEPAPPPPPPSPRRREAG